VLVKTVSAILAAAVLAALVAIPVYRYNVQEMREPHPSVTSIDSSLPRINYMEQVRDIRRDVERRPHVRMIRHNSRDRSHFIEHEVVVRFSPRPDQAALQKMLNEIDGKIKRDYGSSMIIKSHSRTTKQLMKYFAEHPDSTYAEPNYILLPNRRPNDQLYSPYQWNLPLIGMEQSWEISQGRSDVTVAVVDTGIDLNHPEFQGKLVDGHNIIEDTNNPQDDNGHGTHVAGVIAAKTNNATGIAGMNWKCKLMPVKAIGSDGSGTAFDIAQGIYWATDHGADVINLSVGNYTSSAALQEACRYAYDRNVVLVAATGNDATDQPGYPAAYKEVLGVSAVDHNSQRADFSNFGDYVDVVAPGVDIASTYIYSDYAALSGTSMACPHVAALASLIRSVHPKMKNTQVMDLIRKTATDLGQPGKDQLFGYGMINVNAALTRTLPLQAPVNRNEGIGGLLNKILLRLRFGLD
jgi:type VII secretion-associated serine protease mycosin